MKKEEIQEVIRKEIMNTDLWESNPFEMSLLADSLIEAINQALNISDVSGSFYSDQEIMIIKDEFYLDGLEEGQMM